MKITVAYDFLPKQQSTRASVVMDHFGIGFETGKHVIAEDQPTFAGGFHQQFAENLAYDSRDIEEELMLIDAVRSQMTRILRSLPSEAFERTGTHAVEGVMTLRTLLERITNHIPHHVQFIEEKRQAML